MNLLARVLAIVGSVACVASPTYEVAIVTAGAVGVGQEIAAALASRGLAVAVVYLGDQRQADAAVEAIVAADGAAHAVRADVTDALDVERLFDETEAAFGPVDVVAHTALRARALVDRQAARRLRRGGAILDISSSHGIPPALAEEMGARDITVNGLAPGVEPPGPGRDAGELLAILGQARRRV